MLAGLLTLAWLAGCGSDGASPTPGPAAEAVIVLRGGGLAGDSTTWRVSDDAAPPPA